LPLPEALIQNITAFASLDVAAFAAVHQAGNPPISVRRNPAKPVAAGHDWLHQPLPAVPWCSDAFYLPQRPVFTLDPVYHAGAYYVQEASSMFVQHALQYVLQGQPATLLDLCAAPGGKSTLLQAATHSQSLLVSNEVIKTRVNILCENLSKWGAANVVVTQNDPAHFGRLPHFFDVMLIDAPCSGSGLLRRDAQAAAEWSLKNVALCSERQQRIVADAWPALAPGGYLFYATCSFSPQENEYLADWLIENLGAESIALPTPPHWGICPTLSPKYKANGYRFYPHLVQGEGFFLSVFKKPGNQKANPLSLKPTTLLPKNLRPALEPWLEATADFEFVLQQQDILAFPRHLLPKLQQLQQALYIKKAGINMGQLVRQQLIPGHELAMYPQQHPTLPKIELDAPQALNYLRRQPLQLPQNAANGWNLITHLQLPLGLVKVMPGRINNYYPKDWRILHL
jgi:16S rRNA C967 or C1407 C5-methylase (RsmB/RsmF family)/NOL1/NOP2/fmu family ribosome biogenesis protein